jgi:hypothetical protein
MGMVVNSHRFGVSGYSGTLTVASGTVLSDLTDFPVYVDLADLPAGFWSAVTSDGGNIRVSQGGTDLPVDVVAIDTGADTGYIFFKDTILTGSNNVYTIEARSGATMAAVTDPLGRNAVWTAYHRVLMGAAAVDRTGSGTTITLINGADFTNGLINLNGTSEGVKVAISTFTDWSMGATATFAAHPSTNSVVASLSPSETGNTNRVTLAYRGANQNMGVWNATNSWTNGGSTFTTGTKRCDVTYDSGGTRTVYTEGASVASAGTSATKPSGSTHFLYLGMPNESTDEELSGSLNFVYFTGNILTADWIKAQFDSWKTTTTFYTLS